MRMNSTRPSDDVRKKGTLVKLKTRKKKFFVLRDEVNKSSPARLEYFQDETKFLSAPSKPRRSILLRDCLDITDGSAHNGRGKGPAFVRPAGISEVIHIFTKKEDFRIGCSSENEKKEWLELLMELKKKSQEGKTLTDQECFECSWDVRVMQKSSGSCRKIKPGRYRFCLSNKSITLISEGSDQHQFQFDLDGIRKLGDTKDLFFLELGNSSSIGEGHLWIEVDDELIASNIHMHVFSRMSGSRPRCPTIGIPGKNKAMNCKEFKRPSIQSSSSTITSSTVSAGGDDVTRIGGQTTSSSSVSSLRSSGSSLPSSVKKSSFSFLPGKSTNQQEASSSGPYLSMEGFKKTNDLGLNEHLRTSSVGNKAEYLKNLHHHHHHQQQQQKVNGSKDAERCSSAPHLKNEGEGQVEGSTCENHKLAYKEGCFYCEALDTDTRKDFYAPLDFEKPDRSWGLCKRASCHIKNKVMTPKQPIGGKIFRPNPLTNEHQHYLHHVVLESNDHPQQRERLPTIDGSMMTSRPAPCCYPRPRALTGEQKNLVHSWCCREALENGYMKMHGFVSKPRKDDDDPYLDMTEGFKKVASITHEDYLDMSIAGDSHSNKTSEGSTEAYKEGSAEAYMDMTFQQPSSSSAFADNDATFETLSSSASSYCSSSSSVSSQKNNSVSMVTTSNLSTPASSGNYMTMSFSPCHRFS